MTGTTVGAIIEIASFSHLGWPTPHNTKAVIYSFDFGDAEGADRDVRYRMYSVSACLTFLNR